MHKFIENIFSVKNNGTKKNIKILGINIKIQSKKLQLRQDTDNLNKANTIIKELTKENKRYKNKINTLSDDIQEITKLLLTPIRENSILLVEMNKCHGEVLVCMLKYFLELGFNVDVIVSKEEYNLNLFSRVNNSNVRIFPISKTNALCVLNGEYIKNYKYIYLNSDINYSKKKSTLEVLKDIPIDKSKILQMCHHLEFINDKIYEDVKLMMLAPIPTDNNIAVVNAHDFGVNVLHKKNKITNFIIIGKIEKARKNHTLLIKALQNLINDGVTDFKITVVAKEGSLDDIDESIRPYIDFKGKLNYDEMWEEMEKADFFLPLLDPENEEHDRYITKGTSGSFQLIYGFRVPCLIAEKFSSLHHFNHDNSIIYKTNDKLYEAIKYAIKMSDDEYDNMYKNLDYTANQIYEQSLNNLKSIVSENLAQV